MVNISYIFTFHYAFNFGAFLQTYALKSSVNGAKIANLSKTFKIDYKTCVGNNCKKYIPVFWRVISLYRYMKKKSRLDRKRKLIDYERLDLNPPLLSKSNKQIHQILDGTTAICGSDQIWNPTFIMGREKIFFADIANFRKRIAYAASIGMKEWPNYFKKWAIPKLKNFDAISVREESAASYLRSIGFNNVQCVCDPTILHTGDFYRREFPGAKIPKNEYAFVYKIRERIPEPVQELFADKVITVDLQKKRTIVSVTDWLGLIDHAKFVVTDSFHCAVFCLLFHKPFIVLPNNSTQQGMNERFATLLGKTGLEYRCIGKNDSSEEISEKLNAPVDWAEVESILQEWRTYSANWLKNALEN